MPETLPVPPSTALLSLALGGRAVEFPSRSEAGVLFLRKDGDGAAPGEADALDITVHRRLTDDVPALLDDAHRAERRGQDARDRAGQEPAQRVRARRRSSRSCRCGSRPTGACACSCAPASGSSRWWRATTRRCRRSRAPIRAGPWKEGEEVWVFEARPALRAVTVTGVTGIDPQQTTLPDEWKSLPAYLMPAGATMALRQQRRGDADPGADQLSLERSLWLDFDGRGLTARDEITGTFRRSRGGWRWGRESRLGRVAVAGKDQFITRLDRRRRRGGARGRRDPAGDGGDHRREPDGARRPVDPGRRLGARTSSRRRRRCRCRSGGGCCTRRARTASARAGSRTGRCWICSWC